jgi:hypothetical protein
MTQVWESIPPAIRTIINVVVGAAFAAAVTYVVGNLSGGNIDLNALGKVVVVAASTALVRAINPTDTAYGVGSSKVQPVPDQSVANDA